MGKKEAEKVRIDSIRARFLDETSEEEEDELKYQAIVAYCKYFNTTFHDGEFPHTRKSYMTYKKEFETRWKKGYNRKKILTFFPKTWNQMIPSSENCSWTVWNSSRLYDYEVYQGGIGNCALVSALSAISNKTSIMTQIFPEFRISKFGVYRVRLCVDGEWKTIVVDDWFPYVKDLKIGVKCLKMIWAPLIEKAIAKICGSYAGLHSYSAVNALSMLTGAPVTRFKMSERSEKLHWKKLKEAQLKQYPMTCGTGSKKEGAAVGISTRHAYTVIDVVEEGSHRLIRVRDPSGEMNWTGKWSNEWNGWTTKLRKRLIDSRIEVYGAFWIDLSDFVRCYDTLTICRYRPSWSVIRAKMVVGGLWNDSQKVIRINAEDTCEMCVSAIGSKCHQSTVHTWISMYKVSIVDLDEIGELIICEPVEHSTKDVRIVPGNYIIMLSCIHESALKTERKVAIHSSIPISAKLCSWSPKKMAGVFQKMVSNFGREVRGVQRTDISIKKYSDVRDTFMIVMAENYTDDKYLHVHIRCDYNDKLRVSREYDRNSTRYADVIPPRCQQILIVLYRHPAWAAKGFPMRIEYGVSEEKLTKIGRSNRASHIPKIEPTEYIHYTTVMDSDIDE